MQAPGPGALLQATPLGRHREIIAKGIGPEPDGRYLHWDQLRHRPPPEGLTTEEWWLAVATARTILRKRLPFADKTDTAFTYVPTEGLARRLHLIDQEAGGSIATPDSGLLNPHTRDRFIVNSLFEEAITSSQLEGAATTRRVAKEMLRTQRRPKNKSERMIINNYRVMLFIRDVLDQPLTPNVIQEMHRIVCDGTLDDPASLGRWRRATDNISVFDHRDGTTLHIPPDATELDQRIVQLCEFANQPVDDANFLHPVIRAVLLHFMLGYDHPFVDGNGRTARALFYWYMARHNYWLMEFVSISSVIVEAPAKYARAYLHTETDNADTTYFLVHQCDVILEAIRRLEQHARRKANEQRRVDELLRSAGRPVLNYRQTALLAHAIRHPDTPYTIRSHRISHNVAYQTARTDLQSLATMDLLQQVKRGNRFEYYAPADLEDRLQSLASA